MIVIPVHGHCRYEDEVVHAVIKSDNSSYAMLGRTIGNTYCCGSMEIFGCSYVTPNMVLEFVKKSYVSIWLFHSYLYWENEHTWEGTNNVSIIKNQCNKLLQHCRVDMKKLGEMEVLITLEILDREKFMEWRDS